MIYPPTFSSPILSNHIPTIPVGEIWSLSLRTIRLTKKRMIAPPLWLTAAFRTQLARIRLQGMPLHYLPPTLANIVIQRFLARLLAGRVGTTKCFQKIIVPNSSSKTTPKLLSQNLTQLVSMKLNPSHSKWRIRMKIMKSRRSMSHKWLSMVINKSWSRTSKSPEEMKS